MSKGDVYEWKAVAQSELGVGDGFQEGNKAESNGNGFYAVVYSK